MSNGIEILIPRGFGGKDGLKALEEMRQEEMKPKPAPKPMFAQPPSIQIPAALQERLKSMQIYGLTFPSIHEQIMEKYGKYPAMNGVKLEGSLIKGSNPYYVVAVNEFLLKRAVRDNIAYRTINQSEAEGIFRNEPVPRDELYVDTSLILRVNSGKMKFSPEAASLDMQFQQMGERLMDNVSYVLPLWTLKLKEMENTNPHSLQFLITEKTIKHYFPAKILEEVIGVGKYVSDEDFDFESGLPTKLYDTARSRLSPHRHIRTAMWSVSRLGMEGKEIIGSNALGLGDMTQNGLILLVQDEGIYYKNPTPAVSP